MELLNLFAKLVLDTSEYKQGIEEAQSDAEGLSDSMEDAGDAVDDLADAMTDAGDAAGDASGQQGDLADSVNESKSASDSAGPSFENLKGVFERVKGAAAAMIAVKIAQWLWDTTAAVAEFGDHIDKTSQKMNMSAKAYQEFGFIAQHMGTNIDSLRMSMKTLAVQAEKGSSAFQELGMSLDEVRGMSQEDLFEATIVALQNVDDQAKRTKLATELLGRGAMELGPLFNASAGDIDNMKDRLNELGGVMSDKLVKDSAAYADAMTDLQTAVQGAKNNIAAFFMEFNTGIILAAANALGYLNRAFADLFPKSYEEDLERNQRKLEALKKSYEEFATAGDVVSAESVWNMIEQTEARIDELQAKIAETADTTQDSVAAQAAALAQLRDEFAETYESVSQDLEGWFGVFDNASYEITTSADEMLANLESQLEFWQQYDQNLQQLSDQGFDKLAQAIAGMGPAGAQFLAVLANLSSGSDEERQKLQEIADKFTEVEEQRNEAAETVTAIEFLDNSDETLKNIQAVKDSLVRLDGSEATITITTVKKEKTEDEDGGATGRAGGLDYVPYHNYPALLHEGEAVLTKSEAQVWRSGQFGGGGSDPNVAVIVGLLEDIVVNGILAKIDSRSLYRAMRSENKTRTTATNYNALAMA